MAALLISAVAITMLVETETESIRQAGDALALRQACSLCREKLHAVAAGVEADLSGTFEDPEGWSWEVTREAVEGGFGTQRVRVVVDYSTEHRERSIVLECVVP